MQCTFTYSISRYPDQTPAYEVCHPRVSGNMFKMSNNLSQANELELFAFISYSLAQSPFHILLQPHQLFKFSSQAPCSFLPGLLHWNFTFLGWNFVLTFTFLECFYFRPKVPSCTSFMYFSIIALFSFIFLQGTYCTDCRKYLVYSFGFCFS